MTKGVLQYGVFALCLLCWCCSQKENKDGEESGPVVEKDAVAVVDSVEPKIAEQIVDTVVDVPEEQSPNIVYDTVMMGMDFRCYHYKGASKESSSEINFVIPINGNATVTKKIVHKIFEMPGLEDYAGGDLKQKLDDDFSVYAKSSDKEGETGTVEGDEEETEYFSSTLTVCPIDVVGGFLIMSLSQWEYYSSSLHPMWGCQSIVFSLASGDVVSQDDILENDKESRMVVAEKLVDLLKEYLEEEEVTDYGLDMLNDNFFFNDSELTYMYNPYEVAYYAAGAPELKLEKEWLKPYMKKDSELYKYWFKN
ncbi:MAG: DUF3298 domain-containing protein [Bacteroidales bacterium]|nr:DUF3298 domain-containing protein [Bacteroidales bacterium]